MPPKRLTTVADWFDNDGPTVPSERTTKAIFARGSYPEMRELRGVVRQPTLLKDGRVLTSPGYDAGSCLMYIPDGAWPDLPAMPEGEDALKILAMKAKTELEEVVEDFPFVVPGKTVWLALVLTIEARFFIEGPLPQYVNTANVPGAGKGALIKAAGVITTGEDPEARALPMGQAAEEGSRSGSRGSPSPGRPWSFLTRCPSSTRRTSSGSQRRGPTLDASSV